MKNRQRKFGKGDSKMAIPPPHADLNVDTRSNSGSRAGSRRGSNASSIGDIPVINFESTPNSNNN